MINRNARGLPRLPQQIPAARYRRTQGKWCGEGRLLTDDDTLVILPLAHLLGGYEGEGDCPGLTADGREAYREVCAAGVLGYRLHTYRGLVAAACGAATAARIQQRHLALLAHRQDLGALLAMSELSVRIGEVTPSTRLGEVTTPVEMNVALALLLGYPGSPHYQVNAGRRTEQGSEIAPDVDGLLCVCLVRARRELSRALSGLFNPGEAGVAPPRPDGLPSNDMSMKYYRLS